MFRRTGFERRPPSRHPFAENPPRDHGGYALLRDAGRNPAEHRGWVLEPYAPNLLRAGLIEAAGGSGPLLVPKKYIG